VALVFTAETISMCVMYVMCLCLCVQNSLARNELVVTAKNNGVCVYIYIDVICLCVCVHGRICWWAISSLLLLRTVVCVFM